MTSLAMFHSVPNMMSANGVTMLCYSGSELGLGMGADTDNFWTADGGGGVVCLGKASFLQWFRRLH
jgi:hypothetical protein